ncbi:hypothetical protein Zmor_008619 [Zophobas morio]|uniref:Uncharacterized protein n=1 Tax=Zophobas morio TaxID=2755281 RepID=A0AA38HKB9_9CUCU|nr:hypothetical protein Zmor_008619 [Zophobas morio]
MLSSIDFPGAPNLYARTVRSLVLYGSVRRCDSFYGEFITARRTWNRLFPEVPKDGGDIERVNKLGANLIDVEGVSGDVPGLREGGDVWGSSLVAVFLVLVSIIGVWGAWGLIATIKLTSNWTLEPERGLNVA